MKAACVLVRRFDGRILAVSRARKSGDPLDFGLPGGKLDEGENTSVAALRELKEETGLETTLEPYHWFTAFDKQGYETTTFVAATSAYVETRGSSEGEVSWVEPEALVSEHCSCREYNEVMFEYFGIHTKFLTLTRLKDLVAQVRFHDWRFDVLEKGDGFLVQAIFSAKDNFSTEPTLKEQKCRKWYVSKHSSLGEVVRTLWKAVEAAVVHEAQEAFLYRGRPIFDPHRDPDKLWELTEVSVRD